MLPDFVTSIPGPESTRLAQRLRQHECRNVTYMDESWPVFWERAEGTNVWDVDGNRFLDFTSAFGVAGLGHGRPEVVAAMRDQAGKLMHGMGDVHPTALKGDLCARLSALTFEGWGFGEAKVTLANSGFEAIETALKTALLATGKRGVIAFSNGYHGLGYGSLLGTDLPKFQGPFLQQLAPVTTRLPFGEFGNPDPEGIGAVLLEPIQGRGGKVVAPDGFLQSVRDWCNEHGVVLIYDEIYSGFLRSGKMFACEWDRVYPDLICLGKALSGGYPISACVGKASIMDAWPVSSGEALHTSTFLGNPVGCAMSLASLDILERSQTQDLVSETSELLEKKLLEAFDFPLRGRGLMRGLDLGNNAGALLPELLKKGLLFLADGPEGSILSFTPPFVLTEEEMDFAISVLSTELET